jgi:hypothetical protein
MPRDDFKIKKKWTEYQVDMAVESLTAQVGKDFLLPSVLYFLSTLAPIDILERADSKPYDDFVSFYSFYLSQHEDETCQRLHVLGTSIFVFAILLHPSIVRLMSHLSQFLFCSFCFYIVMSLYFVSSNEQPIN